MAKKRLAMVGVASHFGDVLRHISQREDIDVLLYTKDPFWRKDRLEGIVPKAKSIDEIEQWKPDAVIMEYTGLESAYNRLSAKFPVFNGSPAITKLETDRVHGLTTMKQNGIEIPRTVAFKSIPEAIEFLKDKDNKKERWYFKQDAVDVSGLTMGEKEPGLLLKDLDRVLEMKELPKGTPCILQQFIDGEEIDFEIWCVNGEIIMPANITIECKKAFAGDLGGTTGASAAVVWADDARDPSPIASLGILKLREWLRAVKYTGELSLNSIVSNGHVYGLEFTCRPGINASFLLLPLFYKPWGEVFIRAAQGELKELPMLQGKVSYGVTFSVYPYPLDLHDTELQAKCMKELCKTTWIGDVDGDIYNSPDIFLGDVYRRGTDELLCAGTDGLLAFNAHVAKTVGGACGDALSDFKLFRNIPNIQTKTDGVPRVYKAIQVLSGWNMLSTVPAL